MRRSICQSAQVYYITSAVVLTQRLRGCSCAIPPSPSPRLLALLTLSCLPVWPSLLCVGLREVRDGGGGGGDVASEMSAAINSLMGRALLSSHRSSAALERGREGERAREGQVANWDERENIKRCCCSSGLRRDQQHSTCGISALVRFQRLFASEHTRIADRTCRWQRRCLDSVSWIFPAAENGQAVTSSIWV